MHVTLLVTRLENYLCKRTGNWRLKKRSQASGLSVCYCHRTIVCVCVSCKATLTEHDSNDNKTRIDNNNNNKIVGSYAHAANFAFRLSVCFIFHM